MSRSFEQLRASPSWPAFQQLCERQQTLFPLLVARLASEAALGLQSSSALDGLCFATLAEAPPPWAAEHSLLAAALQEAFPERQAGFFSLAWYAGVLSRLHLNSFRVSIPRADVSDLPSLLRRSQTGNGTAVYLLPSLLNHSCSPSLEPVWRTGDSQVAFLTRREVSAGEELTVSYVDADAPVGERQEALSHGYGFECRCAACVEEMGGETKG